jgi:hypothetical protein
MAFLYDPTIGHLDTIDTPPGAMQHDLSYNKETGKVIYGGDANYCTNAASIVTDPSSTASNEFDSHSKPTTRLKRAMKALELGDVSTAGKDHVEIVQDQLSEKLYDQRFQIEEEGDSSDSADGIFHGETYRVEFNKSTFKAEYAPDRSTSAKRGKEQAASFQNTKITFARVFGVSI